VTDRPDKFKCPECSAETDPTLNFCIICGAKLPKSNITSDLEPDPDNLYDEPTYIGGGAAENESAQKKSTDLPRYGGDEPEKPTTNKSSPPPSEASGCLIGTLIVTSLLLPPVGIITAIVWAFQKPYRKAVLPVFLATIAGILFVGWMFWGMMRADLLLEPYNVMDHYLVAQSQANLDSGHYMSLIELKRRGYLKADFPSGIDPEIQIMEHVLGPTGFIVEIRPGEEEMKFFKIESLWSDHTGDIRIGSRDGPAYKQ